MPQVTLDQATIEYRVFGPKDSAHPPVLFIHGALVDYRLWAPVAERLADNGFRCILPTLPLGSHIIPVQQEAELTPEALAAMIHDFIAALGLEDVTLVGSDTGGALCQMLVDTHPDAVGRLVLTNCDAFDKFPPFPFNAVFALLRTPVTVKAAAAMMRLRGLRHSPLGYGLLTNKPDPDLTTSWLRPSRNDVRIRRNVAALARSVGATDLTAVSTRMSKFTKPVAVVWGQADRCFTPELGRRLANQFPNATVIEVPGARTFVSLDEPEAVADAVVSLGARTG